MKRRITQLAALGLATGGVAFYLWGAQPAPQGPVRLLKPIPFEQSAAAPAQSEPLQLTGGAHEGTRRQPLFAPRSLKAPIVEQSPGIPADIQQTQANPDEPAPFPGSDIVAAPVDEATTPANDSLDAEEPIPPPPSSTGSPGVPQSTTPDAPVESYQEPTATSEWGGEIPASSGVALETMAPPYCPANMAPDALPWVGEFEDRARMAPIREDLNVPLTSLTDVPPDFVPWWQGLINRQMRNSQQVLPVNVDVLTVGALEHAPQVLSLKTDPQIRSTYFCEEAAAFDWVAFWNTKWSDNNDPVGNTLTTGGPDRFKDRIWNGSAGLRRRNQLGGELEFSQKLGYEDQNSLFFVPPHQGTTRLQLAYTQPLLNGAGRAYNQSRMILAQIDSERAFDEVSGELQSHLLKVTEAYWELYRARAAYLQRQRLLLSAEEILQTLQGRQEIDAMQRQLLRAQAAVASRRAEIVRTAASIRNAESKLRLLVNDPRLLEVGDIELIPLEPPARMYVPVSMTASLQTALSYRPDISQAIRDLRATGVRLGIAKHEMLPRLDLVMQTYVAGLAAGGDIGSSYGKQWSEGRPGYSAGLEFEMPLGNRAANARLDRRQLELNRAAFDFKTTVETGLTEVELSVREAETTYREMISQFQSLLAADTEAAYLRDRWQLLPGDDRSTIQLLEDLLDAQERLADTESEFVAAEAAYVVSLTRVRKSMGTLLQADYLPFDVEGEPTPTMEEGQLSPPTVVEPANP